VIARQQQLFNGDPIPWVREQLSEFGVPAELLADPAAASFIEKCSKVRTAIEPLAMAPVISRGLHR